MNYVKKIKKHMHSPDGAQQLNKTVIDLKVLKYYAYFKVIIIIFQKIINAASPSHFRLLCCFVAGIL